jgi:threonine/homoserine/homoserine lactone efflux protein
MTHALFLATIGAGFLYVISPGPAVLALFGLAAAHGRGPGARFVTGHLAGDFLWGGLALAAIIGINQIGPLVFEALGFACGAYLSWLGARAALARRDAPPVVIGAQRPLMTGVLFGLSNPKAYPVALAMFAAIAAPFAGALGWRDAPRLLATAFIGFILADIVLVYCTGLTAVRRFFARHGRIVTRMVGLMFIAFGAASMFDALRHFFGRV